MKADVVAFIACFACGLWILVGYPVLLSWKTRRKTRSVNCAPIEPLITAIIPVHNGAPFLAAKIESVLASHYPPARLEVLVLSDGSTDNTDAIAQSYCANGRVR